MTSDISGHIGIPCRARSWLLRSAALGSAPSPALPSRHPPRLRVGLAWVADLAVTGRARCHEIALIVAGDRPSPGVMDGGRAIRTARTAHLAQPAVADQDT